MTIRDDSRRRRIRLVLCLGAFVAIFALGELVVFRDREWLNHLWANALWTLASGLSGLRCIRTARKESDEHLKSAWKWFGAACFAWFLGMLWWTWREQVDRVYTPFPEVSEIGFLAFVPCWMIGVVHYRRFETRAAGMGLIHIGAIGFLVCLMALISSILLYEPISEFHGTRIYLVSVLLYPVLHMSGLLFVFLTLTQFDWGVRRRVLRLILLMLVFLTGATTVYALTLLLHTYLVGQFLDSLWVIAFAFVYWAAFEEELLIPESARLTTPVPQSRLISTFLPSALLVSVLLGYVFYGGRILEPVFFLLSALALLTFFQGLSESGYRNSESQLIAQLEEERKKLETVLDQIPVGCVIAQAPSGKFVRINRRAEEILGPLPRPVQSITQYSEHYQGFHPDGRPYLFSEWPLARSILSREIVTGEEIDFVFSDGRRCTLMVNSAPVFRNQKVVNGVTIFFDVTERKQIERDRASLLAQEKKARIDAERLASVRDDFIAIASHELRTPLTPLMLQVDFMKRRVSQTPQANCQDRDLLLQFLDLAAQEIKNLAKMAEDLLDFSRIGSGVLELNRERIDLGELVQEVVNRHSQDFMNAGNEISLKLEPHVIGHWDRGRIEQLVASLLSNVIKFGAGNPVEISVSPRGNKAVLTIQDHGPGMSSEDLSKIFERFERPASPMSFGGLGLGLYRSREIVKAHGGAIGVESELGKGSIFVVELPRSK